MDEPTNNVTSDVEDILGYLRVQTEKEVKDTKWLRFRVWFGDWYFDLFFVRLWFATTSRVIQSIEQSDPLSLGNNSGSAEGDHKNRKRIQEITKTNQRLRLRRLIANWAIFFVIAQLACSNVFFWLYLSSNSYVVEPQVMIAWLSACVVEVIGILVVIARSLFPRRDKNGSDIKKPK